MRIDHSDSPQNESGRIQDTDLLLPEWYEYGEFLRRTAVSRIRAVGRGRQSQYFGNARSAGGRLHGTVHGNTIEVMDDLRLPEGEQVELTIERVKTDEEENTKELSEGRTRVYEILSARYNSGHTDTAARHNERQPLGWASMCASR